MKKRNKKKQNLNLVIVKVGHFISVEKIHKIVKENVFSLNWEKKYSIVENCGLFICKQNKSSQIIQNKIKL